MGQEDIAESFGTTPTPHKYGFFYPNPFFLTIILMFYKSAVAIEC